MFVVRALKTVRSDVPGKSVALVKGEICEAERNRLGAVSTIFLGGGRLGLKPDEYEVIRDDEAAEDDEETAANGKECSQCLTTANEPVCMYCAECYGGGVAEVERLRKVIWRAYRERAARIKPDATEIMLKTGDSEHVIWEHRCEIDETWMREAASETKLNNKESQGYRWALEPEPEAHTPTATECTGKEKEMFTSQLKGEWQASSDTFEELPKQTFKQLCHDGKFVTGPLVGSPSKFGQEFGPYDPHRWAFGELPDGRLVCCDVAAPEPETT